MSKELSSEDMDLLRVAKEQLLKSPNRDENNVLAAIRTRQKRIFTAFNLFKGYWSGSHDAELGAVAVAIAELAPQQFEPELFVGVKFEADREHVSVINSCGHCLQWMKDYYPEVHCVTVQNDSTLVVSSVQELLIHGYDNNRGALA
ncbi:MAG TPA: hypothetical protein VHD60_04615 [Candidatus Saccharimonadales bacterium]|nr:hypothetical protein [Candidatus Saccharimonadales bacterium]